MARLVRYETSLVQTILGGTLLGLIGGALTFVHYQSSVWPDALPVPGPTQVVLTLLLGFSVALLELDMRSYISTFLLSAPVSLVTYVGLDFAPLLLENFAPADLFLIFVFAGGQPLSAWLLFYPMLYVGGSGVYILYRNGPFS
ncbi:MAG: hypothetical protein ABEI99_09320 [Halobaculum sp.]